MLNPKFLQYTYYHCTKSKNPSCSQKTVSAEKIETQIDDLLSRIQISVRFKDWAIKYLRQLHEEESKIRNDDVQARNRAYEDCLQRIDNLVRLKTAPQNGDGSFLSGEEYGRQRMELLNEKNRLEELLQDTGHRVNKWLELSEKAFEFACTARERFAKGDPNTKKEILATIGSNLKLKDKMQLIEARTPFLILEKSLPPHKSEKESIEPENIGALHRQKEVPASPCLSLLRDVNDARTLEQRM